MASIVVWQESASTIADLVTAAALVVGGAWGYFRFIRGRVFARRAEVTLGAAILPEPLSGLQVTVAVRNTGASKISLSDIRFVETFGITGSDWPTNTNADWGKPIISTRVLNSHDWIESGETVQEEFLVPASSKSASQEPYVAYLVRAHISSEDRQGRRNQPTSWTAQTVVFSSAPALGDAFED